MLHAIVKEWQNQFTFVERVLNKPDKKLILFGAGQMLWDYMDTLGDKYPPYFAVDNGKMRWGTKVHGVEVKAPAEILNVPEDERNVVICCMYYDAISAQLKTMGVEHSEFQDRYFV
jgi:FlaA1/EpsC-like NDP-sugar epimerase